MLHESTFLELKSKVVFTKYRTDDLQYISNIPPKVQITNLFARLLQNFDLFNGTFSCPVRHPLFSNNYKLYVFVFLVNNYIA